VSSTIYFVSDENYLKFCYAFRKSSNHGHDYLLPGGHVMRLLIGLLIYVFLLTMGTLFLRGAAENRSREKPRLIIGQMLSAGSSPQQLNLPIALPRRSVPQLARASLGAIIDKRISSVVHYFFKLS
jgi:hypothetical protein